MMPKPYHRQFSIYDETYYIGKPTNFARPIYIAYEKQFWKAGEDKLAMPPQANIETIFQDIRSRPQVNIIIIDIEHWDVHNNATYRGYLLSIMQLFKDAFPNHEIGNYAIAPTRNISAPMYPTDHVNNGNWRFLNNKSIEIAAASDVLFPSLYTLHEDPRRWETYAIANIEEARRYVPRKKIIPLIMPVYHANLPSRSLEYIDSDFWKLQLMTVYRMCDGVVIWYHVGGNPQWDVQLPWLKPTIEFMNEYGW